MHFAVTALCCFLWPFRIERFDRIATLERGDIRGKCKYWLAIAGLGKIANSFDLQHGKAGGLVHDREPGASVSKLCGAGGPLLWEENGRTRLLH